MRYGRAQSSAGFGRRLMSINARAFQNTYASAMSEGWQKVPLPPSGHSKYRSESNDPISATRMESKVKKTYESQGTARKPRHTRGLLIMSMIALASLAACGGGGGSGSDGGSPGPGPNPPAPAPTPAAVPVPVPPALTPAGYTPTAAQLQGTLEYGQTALVVNGETRTAPRPVPGRSTLLMFTPSTAIADTQHVFVEATLQGVSLGRLYMKRPGTLMGYAEDRLTTDALPRYSDQAWNIQMPSGWIKPGVQIVAGYDVVNTAESRVYNYRTPAETLSLAAPSEFTIARSKVLVWEDANTTADTMSAERLADEVYARTPVSKLRIVDYAPARWSYYITNENTSARVTNPQNTGRLGEVIAATGMLVNRANTGLGLPPMIIAASTVLQDVTNTGDASPLAQGASLIEGRYQAANGSLQNAIPDLGAASYYGKAGAGAIDWGSECSQLASTVLAMAMGMPQYVTEADFPVNEYPGTVRQWSAAHPQAFDAVRGVFRTWYEATDNFSYAAPLTGRMDPLEGGERADSQSCFSPYTDYTTSRMQAWLDNSPTLRTVDGVPGFYRWNNTQQQYVTVPADWRDGLDVIFPNYQLPVAAMDVPVVTVVGTLGQANIEQTSQLYPPMFAASGNTFTLPQLEAMRADRAYQTARYAARVTYADGRQQAIPIPAPIGATSLTGFSFNLPAADNPTEVALFRLAENFNNFTDQSLNSQTLLSTQVIAVPGTLPEVHTRGGNALAEARTVTTTKLCTTQVCDKESANVTWHPDAGSQLYFVASDASYGPTAPNADASAEAVRLTVPMNGPNGVHLVQFRATRTVTLEASGARMNSANYWSGAEALKDGLQRLDIWVHADDNKALPAGTYTMNDALRLLDVHGANAAGDGIVDSVRLKASFTKS